MTILQPHKKKKIAAITAGLAGVSWFFYQQNNSLVTTEFTIASERLPESFKGYKIIHLSDLHQKSFGKNQALLIEKVKQAAPDMIAFTGDLIDARAKGKEPSITLIEQLVTIAPVYYVTGNHEGKSGDFSSLKEKLIERHVNVLESQSKKIQKGQEEICLLGVNDPEVEEGRVEGNELHSSAKKLIEKTLADLDKDSYKILLSHRPELFPIYSELGIDLTLSGHAHGGQIRLPFIGGVFAPGQGLFPKYSAGEFVKGHAHMMVSRGLGPSIFPTRLFNRPEIISITLAPQYRLKDL